jgi:uncharacterized membrane protein YfcA
MRALLTYAIPSLAGLAGGAMNALAGGGSFVTIPALIAAGAPSVQANASSTVALYPGGLAGTWAWHEGLVPVGGVSLRVLGLVTAVGGLLGALLLLWTPSSAFDLMIPWLLLFATLLLAFGNRAGALLRRHVAIGPAAMLAIQFVLGTYGGYFGGGVGIMMISVWSLLGTADLRQLHPARTLMVSAANSAAVALFVVAGAVAWRPVIVMLAGGALGGYAGGYVGRRLDARLIRASTLVITCAITAIFFWRAYGHLIPA